MVNIPAIAKGGGDDALGAYLGEIGKYELLTAEREVELAQAIEAGREADRLLEEGVFGAKERIRLKRRSDRGREASSLFLVSNLRLVVANAKKHSSMPGIDLIDLISEGNIGLIRAVEKFEWRRGFKFSTYATWWIKQAISRAIADKSRTVRVPVHLHDTVGLVRAAVISLRGSLGREPTVEEVAEATGVNKEKTELALSIQDTASLDKQIGEDGAMLGDFVEDEGAVDPLENAESVIAREEVASSLRRLPERECAVITLRYGFGGSPPQTLTEIGRRFDLTRERIRQIERLALCRMRHPSFGIREQDLR